MTEIISTSTVNAFLPQLNKKAVIIKTPAGAATGDTLDVSAHFTTIDMVIVFADDGTAGIMIAAWSGTDITLGTITTGIHHLLVIGTT